MATFDKARRGFTLVEVLVALAIIAIALAAASRAASVAIDSAQESRLRTLATWVAQNRIAELNAQRAFPPAGSHTGHSSMSGIDFEWRETVSDTPNKSFRKVEVRVMRPQADQSLVALNGYLLQSVATGTP